MASLKLTITEQSILSGETGTVGDRMAMEIVTKAAQMLGASKLIPIHSSHIDGCLFHGTSGVLFCEKLADAGGVVKVQTTTNVGSLNLLKPDQVRLSPEKTKLAFRLMSAHQKMGCATSWTCAPYQAGHRPSLGEQVAWGESNAVAFVNTVLGARTNRYGDFLDIACAISERAPYYGLHILENRKATLLIDVRSLAAKLRAEDAFYPVLGSIIGRLVGETICAVIGIPKNVKEDQLKALCAGAASTGSVALIHIIGVTPEAPDMETAFENLEPQETIHVNHSMIIDGRNKLSLAFAGPIDCIALGSPHFSIDECRKLFALAKNRKFKVPVYVCIGRHTLAQLKEGRIDTELEDLGVEFVVDTCVVVTPILPEKTSGVMMTNSAKFAHYASGNTGYKPVFGTLEDCVDSAQKGYVVWNQEVWG